MSESKLDAAYVRAIMAEIGPDCILIGGWASNIHLARDTMSHDVDTILDPLGDRQRVVSLISGTKSHLSKWTGEIHGEHVDLYEPYVSRLGDIPVERLLPYAETKHGVRVLIPEAHLLTKMVCVLDAARSNSEKGVKDAFEVRGMMDLSSASVAAGIWSLVSGTDVRSAFGVALSKARRDITGKEARRFRGVAKEWSTAVDAVADTLSDEYAVKDDAMFVPMDRGVIAKFKIRGGAPVAVTTLVDPSTWSGSRAVVAGDAARLLKIARSTHPAARALPERVAAEYGRATGTCLVCGTALTDPESQSRGVGPTCISRIR